MRQPTVGIVDMGGASVQIAVELNLTDDSFGGAVENINLGCREDDRTYRFFLHVPCNLRSVLFLISVKILFRAFSPYTFSESKI